MLPTRRSSADSRLSSIDLSGSSQRFRSRSQEIVAPGTSSSLGSDWRHGVEAETRPRDRQALERRLALKLRDGDVSSMSLLLLDSRHNRDFVRAHADALAERFPVPGRRALELLRAGVNPGGNSIILL